MRELIKKLNNLAAIGLGKMYDFEAGLFHFKCKKIGGKIVKEGYSIRYTIICLIGLAKFEATGKASSLNVRNALKKLLLRVRGTNEAGDLGLLLWLCSIVVPQEVKQIYEELRVENVLNSYLENHNSKTVELAWCLTGLANCYVASEKEIFKELAEKMYRKLIGNFGEMGIFGHGNEEGLSGFVRGRIGCFADQVYPIYALTKFQQISGKDEALKIAVECADKICQHQGPMGQWWWHYDSMTGKVIGRYPVYSVHQDGMAPMALFEVGKASGSDYSSKIYKGLGWIAGQNELGHAMLDEENSVIWRNIHRRSFGKYIEILTSLFFSYSYGQPRNLKVLYECWSYHLGWLLYAFADKES
jgi:hypothetical protein